MPNIVREVECDNCHELVFPGDETYLLISNQQVHGRAWSGFTCYACGTPGENNDSWRESFTIYRSIEHREEA
jgi:hypothetical protein